MNLYILQHLNGKKSYVIANSMISALNELEHPNEKSNICAIELIATSIKTGSIADINLPDLIISHS